MTSDAQEPRPTAPALRDGAGTIASLRPAAAPVPKKKAVRKSLTGLGASLAAVALLATVFSPLGALSVSADSDEDEGAVSLYASAVEGAQLFAVDDDAEVAAIDRSDAKFTVYVKPKPKPKPTPVASTPRSGSSTGFAPPAAAASPGSAQAIAASMVC